MNNDEPFDFSPSAPRRSAARLIAGCAVLALFALLGRNALISSEGELAESVRQFQLGSELFLPSDDWSPDSFLTIFSARITYWLSNLTGMTEWTLRLPAALAALLMLSGGMKLTDTYFDSKTTCTAGWMLLGSYGFLYWGRHASWGMFIAAVTIWLAVLIAKPEKNFFDTTILFFLIFAGIVLGGFTFILAALPLILLYDKSEGNKLPVCSVVPAVCIAAAAVILLTGGLIYSPDRSWQGNLDAVGNTMTRVFLDTFSQTVYPGSSISWYAALVNLPRLLLPWLPVTLAALITMLKCFRKLSAAEKKLLFCAAAMFILLGIFPGKRWQYQLPMLPFFIILTAAGITGEYNKNNWFRISDRIMNWGFTLLGSLTAAVAITYPLWEILIQGTPPLILMTAVPLLGFIAVGFLVFDTGPNCAEEKLSGMYGPWSGYILAGVILSIALWCVAIPSLTKFRTGRPFWKKCGKVIRKTPALPVIFCVSEPSSLAKFYMNISSTPHISAPENLTGYLNKCEKNSGYLITQEKNAAILHDILSHSAWQAVPEITEGHSLYLLPDSKTDENKFILFKFSRKKVIRTN